MKLYARAMNGKVKVWSIDILEDGYTIEITHGYLGGNYISSRSRSNSAFVEFNSKVRSKRREGYKLAKEIGINDESVISNALLLEKLPLSNLDLDYNLKPMKAQKFEAGKFSYPAFIQPKINGIRAVLRWEVVREGEGIFAKSIAKAVFRSKEGLIYSLPHITDKLTEADFKINDELIAYDGELYIHGEGLNIIKSAIPMVNYRGTLSVSSNPNLTKCVKFWIFDLSIDTYSQAQRIELLGDKLFPMINYAAVELVESTIVYDDDAALQYTDVFINNGFEGAVLRDGDALYAFGKRPMSMVKIKKFSDAEFEIIDVIPKPKEPETGLFVLKNDINDAIFECNPMGTYAQRSDFLINKSLIIGKKATVKFYERSGIKQVPFHANVVTVRDYD